MDCGNTPDFCTDAAYSDYTNYGYTSFELECVSGTDSDSETYYYCDYATCTSSTCDTGYSCDSDGYCRSTCTDDDDCGTDGYEYCDTSTGICTDS